MAKPMRVAQILNRMDSGGIEAVVMNYYRQIDRSQVQFDFYLAEDSAFPQREELEKLGAGIHLIPAYSRPVAYHKALYQAFKEKKYPVVHAHLSTMSLFSLFAAWRAKVPVRICHNHSTAHWGEGKKTLLKYILRPFNKIFATDYFACGETAGRWMYGNRSFDAGKVTVMPNAIDTKRFSFDVKARESLREELEISQNAFVVGHVGRFMYQKNHNFLIDLFAEVLREKPDAVLLLIGEGELTEQIQKKVQDLGIERSVIFTGARRDVHKLYSVMDVFCLPSFYEGMPVVAWEAQANGLPCVFSSEISGEAEKSPACSFLDIKQRADIWSKAVLEAVRQEKNDVPDIRQNALVINNFYIQG